MDPSFVRSLARRLAAGAISALALGSTAFTTPVVVNSVNSVAVHPLISDWAYLGNDGTPPSQAACIAVSRRCFNPAAMIWAVDTTYNPGPALWRATLVSARCRPGPVDLALKRLRCGPPASAGTTMGEAKRHRSWVAPHDQARRTP